MRTLFLEHKGKKSTYIFLVFTLLVLIMPVFSSSYMMRMMITMASTMVAALSLNIVLGYMGYPSLCQTVFYGVGAYTMALMTVKLGASPWLALLLSPITTFVIGYLVAIPFLKLRSMFFAIGTIAFMGVFNAVLLNLANITGGDAGLRGIPRLFESDIAYFYLILLLVFIVLFLTLLMTRSNWGKALIAIREDEDLAPHFGINTAKYKRMTFAVTSAFTGVAGAIFMSYQTYISSHYFTIGSSFTALAAAVIGGSGTILGPIYGSLIVLGAPEIFRGMNMWRPSFVGAVLVLVILLSPDGIIGIYKKLINLFKKGGTK